MGLLSRVLSVQALSPENPANPLQPAGWLNLMEAFGLDGNASGVNVNVRHAMRQSAVKACVAVLAETLGSMPLQIFEKTRLGKRLAEDHRLFSVLHDAPNSQMTSTVFVQAVQAQASMYGNGYALIQRDGAGRVVALWPLPSERMRVRRLNGVVQYMLEADTSDERSVIFQAADILYIPFMSFDGLTARNPIEEARESIGLTIAAERFGAQFFGRGTRPSGVLTHPSKLGKEAAENLRASWQNAYSGRNSHGVAVLEEGMKFEPLMVNPQDSQFMELRNYQLSDIVRLWRVPPHMIGILERSTNNNIEQQAREFIQYTMLPWVTKWEQELNRKLFAGSDYYPKFNFDALLRGDFQARSAGIQVLRNSGVFTANDGRAVMDLDPVPAQEGGDVLLAPLNMAPLSQLVKNQDNGTPGSGKTPEVDVSEAPAAPGGDPAARLLQARYERCFSALFQDAAGRVLNREKRDQAHAERVWLPVLAALAESLAAERGSAQAKPEAYGFLREYTATLAHRSAAWQPADKVRIASDEFNRAYGALVERV